MISDQAAHEGAEILLERLGSLRTGERTCILSDPSTQDLGSLLQVSAEELGASSRHHCIGAPRMHGEEPPPAIAEEMATSDLVLGLTRRSLAHTRARQDACDRGARYLSLPEYSIEMLGHAALRIDYRQAGERARVVADILSAAREISVRSPLGTDLWLDIRGRTGNFCPGYVDEGCRLGSPPDIEANVAPLEASGEGMIVVDGSIPFSGFGLLRAPVTLKVSGGRVVKVTGPAEYVRALEELFERAGPRSTVVAEFGVGLNPAARLCGNMLVDEGALGTCHIGLGANSTIGGENALNFHLDFVLSRAASYYVDDEFISPEG